MLPSTEKTSFFSALKGTFCGTAVFAALKNQKLFTSLLHLLVFCILAGAVTGLLQTRRIIPELEQLTGAFVSAFGELNAGRSGITPTKEPLKSRIMLLPRGGKILYRPENVAAEKFTMADLRGCNFLFLWRPRFLAVAFEREDGMFQLQSRSVSGKRVREAAAPELLSLLNDEEKFRGEWPFGEGTVYNSAEFLAMTKLVAGLYFCFSAFFSAFGTTLLFTGLFSLSFKVFNGRKLTAFTALSLWKTGMYAAWPCIAIAGCFPALDLPFFSYTTVFMFTLMIYWICIINRRERDNAQRSMKA